MINLKDLMVFFVFIMVSVSDTSTKVVTLAFKLQSPEVTGYFL